MIHPRPSSRAEPWPPSSPSSASSGTLQGLPRRCSKTCRIKSWRHPHEGAGSPCERSSWRPTCRPSTEMISISSLTNIENAACTLLPATPTVSPGTQISR
uniref:Uncharacterized protein n=1 Tax=Arundo donax TaxID=35708 RepID=A0A0A9EUB1_ARUDO